MTSFAFPVGDGSGRGRFETVSAAESFELFLGASEGVDAAPDAVGPAGSTAGFSDENEEDPSGAEDEKFEDELADDENGCAAVDDGVDAPATQCSIDPIAFIPGPLGASGPGSLFLIFCAPGWVQFESTT